MADEENRQVGAGVPGSDPVHKEGIEHVKEQVEQKQDTQAGEGTVLHTRPAPISPPQPPASNPGAGDASGGIPSGAGGLSSTARIESPVPASEEGSSIVDTMKSYLGLGSAAPKEKEAADTNTVLGSVTVASGIAAGQTADLVDRTRSTRSEPAASTSDSSAPTGNRDGANSGTTAVPSSSATTLAEDEKSTKQDESADQKPVESTSHKAPGSKGNLENRDAIPTAGGQQLGTKHWGESEIVPDNPKPRESSAGISSSAGQPNSEVADNTAKNTGGATGGPHGSTEEKKGIADKLKDKLPFGKKE